MPLTVNSEDDARQLRPTRSFVLGIIRQGRERALDGPRNYPSGEKERYGRDWWRWPRNYPSGAKSARRTGPGIIRWGRRSVADRTDGAGPRIICRGQRERVGRAPELSVGGEKSVRTGLVALAYP